jgi:hypothetical protein
MMILLDLEIAIIPENLNFLITPHSPILEIPDLFILIYET